MRFIWVGVIAAATLVAAPNAARAQSTATAAKVTCKDGTTSAGGQGACSHHGGIATATSTTATSAMSTPGGGKIPNQKPAAPTKTGAVADSVGAIAQCNDGMFWDGTTHQGACSGHKGVKRWLTASK